MSFTVQLQGFSVAGNSLKARLLLKHITSNELEHESRTGNFKTCDMNNKHYQCRD